MNKILMTVGGALALLSPCHATGGGDDDDDPKIVSTTLSAIRETPESFKGVWVSFSVQYTSAGRLENPFFTRFVASDYSNFWCWADEQTIWRKDQFDDVFPLLFVNKENSTLPDMMRLHRYDRIQVTGIVQNTFQGQPWIEVTKFSPLSGKVDSATLSHLFRGEAYMHQRKWTQAISELSLAPAEGVPPRVQAAAHRDLGICHLRLGEHAPARQHLAKAAELAGDAESAHLLAIAEKDPSLGLDRQVNRQGIQDYEHPLWEAFADPESNNRPTMSGRRVPAQPMPVIGR